MGAGSHKDLFQPHMTHVTFFFFKECNSLTIATEVFIEVSLDVKLGSAFLLQDLAPLTKNPKLMSKLRSPSCRKHVHVLKGQLNAI